MSKNHPRHSIAVASRLSGAPIETLRAWERRYGFPRPTRIEGTNRRAYSDEEISRLRLVMRALERGFRAGDVVPRTQKQIEALLGADATVPDPSPSPSALPGIDELIELLATDRVSAFDLELRRLAGALGPRAFVTGVAHPLAVAVGDAWRADRLEVRHEHYATEALSGQLRLLLGGLQDVTGSPTVVLATLPGEMHGLGLTMIGLYLALSGAKPRILGTNTPAQQIAEAARALRADVVGLTITVASVTSQLGRDVRALSLSLPRGVRLWLGGSGAASVGSVRGADLVTDWSSLDDLLASLPRRTS